jgi:hypothetical protein
MSSKTSQLRKKYKIPMTSPPELPEAPKTPKNEESPRTVSEKYDQCETTLLIETLNKNLQEEKEKNKILEQGNYSQKKEDLLRFSEKYSDTIYQHMNVLDETVKELKTMVETNDKLSTAKEDYEHYISRHDTTRLLETVQKLAHLKSEGEDFLMSRRIKK